MAALESGIIHTQEMLTFYNLRLTSALQAHARQALRVNARL